MTLILLLLLLSGCSWPKGFYGQNDTEPVNNTVNETNSTTDNESTNKTTQPDLKPDYIELEIGYYDLDKLTVADTQNEMLIRTISGMVGDYDMQVLNSIPAGSQQVYKSLEREGFETIVEGEAVIAYKERSGITIKKNFEKKSFEDYNSILRTGAFYTSINEGLTIAVADSDKKYATQALQSYEQHASEKYEGDYLILGTTYSDCYYYNGGTFEDEKYQWYPEMKNDPDYDDEDTVMGRDVCAYNTFITRFSEEYSVIDSRVDDSYLDLEDASDITSFKPISITIKIFEEGE